MGSAPQQLSQLAGVGSLPPFMAYLLLYDAMFWVLATWFCICAFSKHLYFFTSGFLPHFLVGFLLPFLCLKGLVCTKPFAKLGSCRILCPFP
jgi:hypothetical protein